MFLPDEKKNSIKYVVEKLDDIYKYKQEIVNVAKRYSKEPQVQST